MAKALRRSIALLVLAAFVSAQGAVWSVISHVSGDDAACAAIDGVQFIAIGHPDAVQVKEGAPATAVEHCAICHLQRAVHSARLAKVASGFVTPVLFSAPVESSPAIALVVIPGFSPRGPPVVLA